MLHSDIMPWQNWPLLKTKSVRYGASVAYVKNVLLLVAQAGKCYHRTDDQVQIGKRRLRSKLSGAKVDLD